MYGYYAHENFYPNKKNVLNTCDKGSGCDWAYQIH